MKKIPNRNHQKGFTLIELMMAMAVFSVIMMIILSGVMQISRMMYKSISVSRTNEATRKIISDLSQEIQFSSKDQSVQNAPIERQSTNGDRRFCSGGYAYYVVYNKIRQNDNDKAFRRKNTNNASCQDNSVALNSQPVSYFDTATELLPINTRILDFSLVQVSTANTWNIKIKVGFGSSDYFTDEINSNNFHQATCRTGSGFASYCATSELSTVVSKRITN